MAKSKIILLKIKTDKKEKHPVVLRLSQGKNRSYLFLGYSCKPHQWNEGLSRFEPSYKKYKDHNKVLEAKESLSDEILSEFQKRKIPFSIELFKRKFNPKNTDQDVFTFWDSIIKEMEKSGRLGNASAYQDAKNALQKYHKTGRLMFQDIDTMFLKRYKTFLRSQKNKKGDPVSDRTVLAYLRVLRAVYYRAITEELISEELNPFGRRRFSLNEGMNLKTKKRAIHKADILKIFNYSGIFQDTKNIFIFSYLTGGMNFTDIAFLKWKNVNNGRIDYKRRKTGKEYSVKITEPIREILNKYEGREYVFPIIFEHHITDQQKRTRIKTALKKFHDELRKIAKDLKIDSHLTSYTARHSMASVLYLEEGASVAFIQEFMGHSEEGITRTYLESIDQDRLDKLQEKLL